MKKFCALKIFVIGVIFSSAMIFSANCSADVDYRSVDVTYLKDIVGNWYDTKGNLVLTISSDYKLNGCPIMSVGFTADTVALYKIVINEGNRNRTIELEYSGSAERGYYEELEMNKNILRKTKNPQYFESIGGIYLRMDKNQVVSLYGEPSKKFTDYDNSTWEYKNLGLKIVFYLNVVREITIYEYGDRKFDWSGLSGRNTMYEFERKYNSSFSQRGNLRIGHGELINFNKSNNSVTLSIFPPGGLY